MFLVKYRLTGFCGDCISDLFRNCLPSPPPQTLTKSALGSRKGFFFFLFFTRITFGEVEERRKSGKHMHRGVR